MQTTVINQALHEIVEKGLFEASGIRDEYMQRVCRCLYGGVQTSVKSILPLLNDLPLASAVQYPATTQLHLQDAAHFVTIQIREVLHQLARNGTLYAAGLSEEQTQAFCNALFEGFRGVLNVTIQLHGYW